MNDVLANPKSNYIYSLEAPRLASNITKQLNILKLRPTKEKLVSFEDAIKVLLLYSTSRVSMNGYEEGAKNVQQLSNPVIALRVRREAIQRANQAASWITATTGTALDITAAMSKKRALSEARADLIGVNELALAFFRGTRLGWGLDPLAEKAWNVSDAHDKDDICDDNEDDGFIGIDEEFHSGDLEPPAHPLCTCLLRMRRGKR